MTSFYLIHIQNDGRGGGDNPLLLGRFTDTNEQVNAARRIRDTHLEPDDRLFWLDIEYGEPIIGAFDPQFYANSNDEDES